MQRLDGMLRCLAQIYSMQVFKRTCPFAKELHPEISNVLKVKCICKAVPWHYSCIFLFPELFIHQLIFCVILSFILWRKFGKLFLMPRCLCQHLKFHCKLISKKLPKKSRLYTEPKWKLDKNNIENTYYINDASEYKYLEEFDHQYIYLESCHFSIYRFRKRNKENN
jgi:hypothetical protein